MSDGPKLDPWDDATLGDPHEGDGTPTVRDLTDDERASLSLADVVTRNSRAGDELIEVDPFRTPVSPPPPAPGAPTPERDGYAELVQIARRANARLRVLPMEHPELHGPVYDKIIEALTPLADWLVHTPDYPGRPAPRPVRPHTPGRQP